MNQTESGKKQFKTLSVMVPIKFAEKVESLAQSLGKTPGKLLREQLTELVEKKSAVVESDIFEYDEETDSVIWRGVLKDGSEFVVCEGLPLETVKKWLTELQNCVQRAEALRKSSARKTKDLGKGRRKIARK